MAFKSYTGGDRSKNKLVDLEIKSRRFADYDQKFSDKHIEGCLIIRDSLLCYESKSELVFQVEVFFTAA